MLIFLAFNTSARYATIIGKKTFRIKLQAEAQKETLAQVSSSKFCEISKNTFSYRIPPVAASGRNSW